MTIYYILWLFIAITVVNQIEYNPGRPLFPLGGQFSQLLRCLISDLKCMKLQKRVVVLGIYRKHSAMIRNYHIFRLFKKLLQLIFFFMFLDDVMLLLFLQWMIQLTCLITLIIVRPYKTKLLNGFNIALDILQALVTIFIFLQGFLVLGEQAAQRISLFGIGLSLLFILCVASHQLTHFFMSFLRCYQKACQQKDLNEEYQKEDAPI